MPSQGLTDKCFFVATQYNMICCILWKCTRTWELQRQKGKDIVAIPENKDIKAYFFRKMPPMLFKSEDNTKEQTARDPHFEGKKIFSRNADRMPSWRVCIHWRVWNTIFNRRYGKKCRVLCCSYRSVLPFSAISHSTSPIVYPGASGVLGLSLRIADSMLSTCSALRALQFVHRKPPSFPDQS